MGMENQSQSAPTRNLTPKQVKTFQKMEPKALGSIQIIIGVLCLCLSISVLQIYNEVHFTPDLIVVVIIVIQILASGSILIHAGRFPSLLWVKATLVAHLVSAAFATAALGLLSRHLPYRQDSYHCEHCRRLEIYAVQQFCYEKCSYTIERSCKLLLDGLLATLILFLVVELVICIIVILFGLSVLVKGGLHLPGVAQRPPSPPQPEDVPVQQPEVVQRPLVPPTPPQKIALPQQVEVFVPPAAHVPEIEPVEEATTPSTEPQVEPIDSIAEI